MLASPPLPLIMCLVAARSPLPDNTKLSCSTNIIHYLSLPSSIPVPDSPSPSVRFGLGIFQLNEFRSYTCLDSLKENDKMYFLQGADTDGDFRRPLIHALIHMPAQTGAGWLEVQCCLRIRSTGARSFRSQGQFWLVQLNFTPEI